MKKLFELTYVSRTRPCYFNVKICEMPAYRTKPYIQNRDYERKLIFWCIYLEKRLSKKRNWLLLLRPFCGQNDSVHLLK